MSEAKKEVIDYKKWNDAVDFLGALIIDLMYIVAKKHDDESEQMHNERVDAQFQKSYQKWHGYCHEDGNEFLNEKLTAFSSAIQMIADDGAKNQIAGVNAPLKKLTKKQEAKILKLLK